MSIRVLIVDDHKIMREGLRSMLEKQPDIEVVAEADNAHKALDLVEKELPQTKERDYIVNFIRNAERGIMKGFSSGSQSSE